MNPSQCRYPHCFVTRSSWISFSSAPVRLQSPGSLIYRELASFSHTFCFFSFLRDYSNWECYSEQHTWDQFWCVSYFSTECGGIVHRLEKNPAYPFLMRIVLIDALTQYLLCRAGESQSAGKQVVTETPFKAPCDKLACCVWLEVDCERPQILIHLQDWD